MRAAAFVGALAAGLFAQTALADADIAGIWDFETGSYHSLGCRLTGTLSLERRADGGFVCALDVKETCVSGRVIDTRQACQADQQGDALSIVSTLLSVSPPDTLYYPDDFALTILSPYRMQGRLSFADVEASATFFRRDGVIS